jgi:hypothetical protein
MPIRTINHPGVEVREQDFSQVAPAIVGTTALVAGLSPSGPSYEPFILASMGDFEAIYGKPVNTAEKYFYYGCKEILDNGGNLISARIPYDNDLEKGYKGVSVSVSGTDTSTINQVNYDVTDAFEVTVENSKLSLVLDVDVSTISDIADLEDLKGTIDGSFDFLSESTHELYQKIKLSFTRAVDMNANSTSVEVSLAKDVYARLEAGTYSLYVRETNGDYTLIETAVEGDADKAVAGIDASVTILYLRAEVSEATPATVDLKCTTNTLTISFPLDNTVVGTVKAVLDISVPADSYPVPASGDLTFVPVDERTNETIIGFANSDLNIVTTANFGDSTDITQIEIYNDLSLISTIYKKANKLYSTYVEGQDSIANDDDVSGLITTLTNAEALAGSAVLFETTPGGLVIDEEGAALLNKSGVQTIKGIDIDYTVDVTNEEFSAIEAGAAFGTAIPQADFFFALSNKSKATKLKEGYYIAVVDTLDAMYFQDVLDNKRDVVISLSTADGALIKDHELARALTDERTKNSLSRDLGLAFPSLAYTLSGTAIDNETFNGIGVCLCKTYIDTDNNSLINIAIEEAYFGSMNKDQRDPATGQSTFIVDMVNAESRFMTAILNTDSQDVDFSDETVLYAKDYFSFLADNELTSVSFTPAQSAELIHGSGVLTAIDEIYEKLSNIDEVDIDIVVDAGLSTIAEFTTDDGNDDPTYFLPNLDITDRAVNDSEDVEVWRTTVGKHINFCENIRKDCMTILDGPRNLVVDGSQKFIRKSIPTNKFANTIGPRLKHVTGLNSSYAALYINWVKIIDDISGQPFWLPPSIKAAGVYLYTHRVADFWDAPAGLNRGTIGGAVDIAFSPSSIEADQVYTKSMNYAKKYPLEGFILEGQKTTQVKPSAFDRVNVRQLFLRLERFVYKTARYFVYEANNEFTRRQFVDLITPTFVDVVNRGGLYDFKIICDDTNNTADVIDRNEMKIAVLLKPVRTAEFILVDFVATRTDASFSEIAAQI